ncbi:MAG: ATP-binding protein, partial [Bacilli bacterium]
MIKVITGLRRSGKSFLLFEIFNNYLLKDGVDKSHIIKFAFDSQDYLDLIGEDLVEINLKKRKVDPKIFNNYLKSKIIDNKMYFILLDEVQLLDSFEAVLNGYLRKDNVDIYVTGSNAKFLSKDVITEFRGRGWQIQVNPLSFKEFKSVYDGSIDEAYNEYIIYGGLPKILEFKTDADKAKYLKNIFEETYLKDIIERNKIQNIEELGELLNFMASSIGSLTNPTKLVNTFDSVKHVKIHHTTITKHIDCFADSFLIYTANRYNINGKSYINSPLKYYFCDMGLRNARLNFRELEQPRLMENVI